MRLAASFLRILFYSHQENLGCAIGRSWLLLNDGLIAASTRYRREAYDFAGAFEEAFGFPYEHLIAFAFAILSKFGALSGRLPEKVLDWCVGEGYFAPHLNAAALKHLPSVFAYLGASFAAHAEAMQGYVAKRPRSHLEVFPIYDRPLLELASDVYVPLDLGYLSAALSEGPYWRLHRHLVDSGRKKEAHRLNSALGRSAEWYVAELLRPLASSASTRRLWLDWDSEVSPPSGVARPDILLLEEGILYVIELTAKSIQPNVAVCGDPERISSGLARIWFEGSNGSPGKLVQLERAWTAIGNGTFTLDGVDRSTRIVPVLLTLRYLPQDPILRRWYDDMMRDRGLDTAFISEVLFLDVPDLERLAVLKMKGTPWRQVLGDFRSSPFYGQGFANHLHYKSIQTDRHPLVAATLRKTAEKFVPTLFTKELIEAHRNEKPEAR